MNKVQMASIASKVTAGDQVDKENRQRLSNRNGMHSSSDTQSL